MHRHRALGDGELGGQPCDGRLACEVVARECEDGIARDAGEDHAVERGRDEPRSLAGGGCVSEFNV